MAIHPTVYLSGPIFGLTFDQANDWRTFAEKYLQLVGIGVSNPLRFRKSLKGLGKLVADYTHINPTSFTHEATMERDHYDCLSCDAILVYLLGAKEVSKGTVFELAWGHAYRKPVILVMEPEGNPNDHPFVREVSKFQTTTLPDGIRTVAQILKPHLYLDEDGVEKALKFMTPHSTTHLVNDC